MQILTPEKIKGVTDAQHQEVKKRVKDYAEEESRLIKNINALIERENEIKRIQQENPRDPARLQVDKVILEGEVLALETRKKAAMIPVKEELKRADFLMSEAVKAGEAVASREHAIKEKEEQVVTRLDDIADTEIQLEEKVLLMNRREKGIEASEERIKEMSESLAGKWADYNVIVQKFNEEVSERERVLFDSWKVLKVTEEKQNEREKEQDLRDKALRDKYETLERAQEEFMRKKNG